MFDQLTDAAVLFVPAACVVLSVVIAPLSIWVSRVHFGMYVKTHHREKWVQLVGEERGRRDFLDFLSMDASSEMARFRTVDDSDLGDPEIRIRRARANRSFKVLIWVWITGALWLVTAAIVLVSFSQ